MILRDIIKKDNLIEEQFLHSGNYCDRSKLTCMYILIIFLAMEKVESISHGESRVQLHAMTDQS
jgi:hypothetical protein